MTTHIESGAGIAEGGRTGRTALVIAVLFALAVFFVPIIGFGVLGYALVMLAQGRARAVHPLTWLVAALFVLDFAADWLSANVF